MSLIDLLQIKSRKSKSPKVAIEKQEIRPTRVKLDSIAYLVEKKDAIPDRPEIEDSTTPKTSEENTVWLSVFFSKFPHYKRVAIHRCSWSSMRRQYILLNTKTGKKEAMSKREIDTKVDEHIPTVGSRLELPSYDSKDDQ